MTVLEIVYHHLKNNGLVKSREHFSTAYLCKSKHWYAVQTHEGRDFSASAAIECLRTLRGISRTSTRTFPQEIALVAAERLLSQHLIDRYSIADVQ
jgi:hypothetical protein